MTKLTPKQSMFVKEYLVDLNATQAAIRAGYSKHTAKDIACQNLAKLYIQEAIQAKMAERAEKVDISAEDVLADIIDTRNTIRSSMAYTDDDGRMIIDSQLANARTKTNELLGKHLKLFTDKVEIEVTKMPSITLTKPE